MTLYINTMAQQITSDDAAGIARGFWISGGDNGQKRVYSDVRPELSYTASTGDEVQFYVFNNANENGFVIVGGDERAEQILGYSITGSFNYDDAPENFKWWLSLYSQQIHQAIAQNAKVASADNAQKTISKSDVTPMLSTNWDQTTPYNCKLASPNYVTGCVATAMSQIMRYYEYPTTSSYGATYDWENMLDSYDEGSYTTEQAAAVGLLMYHAGCSVNMQYGSSSGAAMEDVAGAYVNVFKYDAGISYLMRDYYSDEKWEDIIYTEIAEGRPVLYGGQSDSYGHAFVLDGYRQSTNTYHINWGWGGYCDGYFLITGTDALKPDGSGTGGAGNTAKYSDNQEATIGIQPDSGNPVVENIVANIFSLDTTTVASGDALKFNIYFNNLSYVADTFYVGLKFTNQSTNKVTYQYYANREFATPFGTGYNISASGINVPTNYMDAGIYDVVPVFRDNKGEWDEMHLSTGIATQSVTITPPAGKLFLTEAPIIGKVGDNGYVTMNNKDLKLKIRNNTDSNITTRVIAWIFGENGGYSKGYYDAGNRTYLANSVTELDLNTITNSAITEGNRYSIRVMDYTSNYDILSVFAEYFTVVPELSYDYVMPSDGWCTICLPFTASVPSELTVYATNSYSGANIVYIPADKIAMNTPYIVTGTPGTYHFVGPSTPTGTYTAGLLTGTTAADVIVPFGSLVMNRHNGKDIGFYRTFESIKGDQYRAYIKTSGTELPNVLYLNSDYVPSFDMGDINTDYLINVADYTALVSLIMGTDEGMFNLGTADFNSNGFADVADLTSLVDVIMNDSGSFVKTRKIAEQASERTYDFTVTPDYKHNLAFNINVNADELTDVQLDIIFPEGISLVDAECGELANCSHDITIAGLKSGGYRLLIHSANNSKLNKDGGELMHLTLKADKAMNETMTSLDITNIYASGYDATLVHLDDMKVNLSCDATEINIVSADKQVIGLKDVYDIAGRRVNKTSKGLYIIDGKKILK